MIADMDASMVRSHDLAHNGETEPEALTRVIPAAPKAIEDVLAIAGRDPGTAINDVHYFSRPRKDETSDNRRSMQPQTRYRNRL